LGDYTVPSEGETSAAAAASASSGMVRRVRKRPMTDWRRRQGPERGWDPDDDATERRSFPPHIVVGS